MAGPADTLRTLWSRVARKAGDTVDELFLDSYREQVDRARELAIAGELDAAGDLLAAVLGDKPDHAGALLVLGEVELVRGRAEAADDAFARALRERPGDAQALIGRGRALVARGDLTPAVELLGRGVDVAGGDRGLLAAAYLALGQAWLGLGDADKAARDLRKAVAEAPDDPVARALLGEVLLADPRTSADEARGHLERAAAHDPAPARALLALGALALGEHRAVDAHALYERAAAAALALAGGEGKRLVVAARVGLGDAALAQRDFAAAHLRYLEALELEPRRAELHARLAALAAALGDSHAAVVAYERALALGGDDAVLVDAVTTAHVAGERVRAVQWANDLLVRRPDAAIALAARAEDLRLAGQPAVARALLTGAADHVEARLVASRCALDLGERAAAADEARAALLLAPASPRARAALAAAYAEAGAGDDDDRALDRLGERLVAALARRVELAHHVGAVAVAIAELDTPLLVTVMGEFSSGKSSFVNAFIGAEVAATGITPTTATINVVKYAHERGGRLVGRDGAARELGWDALHAALRALTPAEAAAIDRVEIGLPLPSLTKVNLIDTPGLNSILPEHEATARGFIGRADAVVWVFTAGQGGKASERKALDAIRAEGKRVLGVLNKRDQLSAHDVREVIEYVGGQLGERVEHIVPFSARAALAWKQAGGEDDGGWAALAGALEERFFAQARAIKRGAVARRLAAIVAAARATVGERERALAERTAAAHAARERVVAAQAGWDEAVVARERRTLAAAVGELYRRAAHEVIELVRPRQLPFGSHSAAVADRDYLIALLADGYEAMLRAAADRVAGDVHAVVTDPSDAAAAIAATTAPLAYARAYVAGFLAGGAVDHFFRADLPKLALEPDTVYHALFRAAPDLEAVVADPLARAGRSALGAAAAALDRAALRIEVEAYELAVSVDQVLEAVAARLVP
ncbi:MAG: dynamin family protein [Kofleriaceae bacterium]|nr:dynamin family protein [Kofleriaceae bacterium]MBP9166572.1 dynamin family protein [Kofleriaceae bacterium]MBP9859682.1 dynamin family protein [Kofleriaceae bacterium]